MSLPPYLAKTGIGKCSRFEQDCFLWQTKCKLAKPKAPSSLFIHLMRKCAIEFDFKYFEFSVRWHPLVPKVPQTRTKMRFFDDKQHANCSNTVYCHYLFLGCGNAWKFNNAFNRGLFGKVLGFLWQNCNLTVLHVHFFMLPPYFSVSFAKTVIYWVPCYGQMWFMMLLLQS